MCSTVFKEKETGVLLFSGEGDRCSTVFGRRKLVLYSFHEEGTGALLYSGEGNWCSTVFK